MVREAEEDLVSVFLHRGDLQGEDLLPQPCVAEEVFHRLGIRAEAVAHLPAEEVEFLRVGGRRDPLVHPQPLAGIGDVDFRDADVEVEVDGGGDLLLRPFPAQFLHRPLQELAIEIEAHGLDMPMLFPPQQVAGAADFQVERGDAEPRPQVAEFADGRQAFARDL